MAEDVDGNGSPVVRLRERIIRMEIKIDNIEIQVKEIRSVVRWVGVTIGGAILLAASNWIVQGGLSTTGPIVGGG